MHLALVFNPTSGKRRGEAIAAQAAMRLGGAGHSTVMIQGADAASARDQLKLAIDAGLDGVVVVGGDGALHGVLDHVPQGNLQL